MRGRGTIAICLIALFAWAAPAHAGAWTLPEGRTQILAGVTYSRATSGFDAHGADVVPIAYEKILTQIHAEYGWNDWLTLILAPEYAHARLLAPLRKPVIADDTAIAGGARVRLFKDIGIFSVQFTAKTAGAFDMSVSADGASGSQFELRLLYGTNFKLFGFNGFFDAQIGERLIAGPRADEIPADLTAGLSINRHTKLIIQSFNILTQGNARPPFSDFRSHKLSLSVVRYIRKGLWLETESYVSPVGKNALAETGVMVRAWVEF